MDSEVQRGDETELDETGPDGRVERVDVDTC